MRFPLVFLTVALLSLSTAQAQTPISEEAFRDAVIAAVRQNAPDAQIDVDGPLVFRVRLADGQDATLNLDYGYERVLEDPALLESQIERWGRVGAGVREEGEGGRDRIVAVVRPQAAIASLAEAFARAERPSQLLVRPLAGDLVEALVFDSTESVRYATNLDLAELGVSADEAWTLARVNLAPRLGPVTQEQLAEGLTAISSGSGLAPSALTDPSFCRTEARAALHYLVPERELYLAADPRTGVSLAELRDRLLQTSSTDSRTVLACRDGRLIDHEAR